MFLMALIPSSLIGSGKHLEGQSCSLLPYGVGKDDNLKKQVKYFGHLKMQSFCIATASSGQKMTD